jgi:dUTP diphosphatase
MSYRIVVTNKRVLSWNSFPDILPSLVKVTVEAPNHKRFLASESQHEELAKRANPFYYPVMKNTTHHMATLSVSIKYLPGCEDIPLPAYQTDSSAAMDIHAAVHETLVIESGAIALIPTGFALAVPEGYEAQIRPRSGLASKNGITVINSPGTIDSDYRGEVKIALVNHGSESFEITRGMRIAQLLIAPVPRVVWRVSEELPATERGAGGFGHTGA